MANITGKTKSGFEYSIDPENLEDFYLLERIGKAQHGDIMALSSLLSMMLGDEQKTALLRHCEDEKGRAKLSRIGDEFAEIFHTAKEDSKTKNSLPSL